jgi:hypothetical protein
LTDPAAASAANKKIKTGFTCAAGYYEATDITGCVDCTKGGTLGIAAAFKDCKIADSADSTASTAA